VRRATTVLALTLAACAATVRNRAVDEARARDEEALASHADELDAPDLAKQYVVVQDGDVAASASLADDAVRAAAEKSPSTPHRFVFRPTDRGTPLYRMAYLAEGGVVVGRRFLADVGYEPAGRPTAVRAHGSRSVVDLGKTPRLAVEIATLDGAVRRIVDAVYDPDFDGGLLVPVAVAAELSLERFEIPGDAEIQVALGRPFRARRASALAKVPALAASGMVEVVYESTSTRR
jgi:hypothetical protein